MKSEVRNRTVLFAHTGLEIGGGIASVNRCIHRALEEAVAEGRLDSVDLLSLDHPKDSPIRCSGEHRSAHGSQLRFVVDAWRLLRKKPDLLIVDHLGVGRAFQLPFIFGFKRCRTVLFIHGGEFWTMAGNRREQVVSRADLLLTNSNFTASRVVDRLPNVRDRIRPVLLCIDPALVESWNASLPAREIPREPAVLIVARMHRGEPGKGHDTLIDAWPRIRQSIPDARLWIVGEGSARSDFEQRANRIGSAGIEFLGRISDQELSNRYRRASLYAMPSQQEGFGLVYAEAMWHGLPCVGSNADAAQEVIRNGESGAVVPYGDPGALAETVIDLLRDRERRERMGNVARHEATTRFAYPRFRSDLLAALSISEVAR